MKVLVPLFAILAASSVPAAGQAKEDKPARAYRTTWLIEPTVAPAGQQSVKSGELLIKQRLLPFGMVTLSDPYVAEKPEDSVEQDTQLVLADGAEKQVFCSTKYKRAGTLSRILNTGPETGTQRCFVDSDADGKFDQTFVGFNNNKTLPGVFGRLPKTPVPIPPLGYQKADIKEFGGSYYVGIQYLGQSGVGKKRRFQLVYGASPPWGFFTFDDMIYGKDLRTKRDSELPKTIRRLGCAISIVGGEKGSVDYIVQSMITPQPFGVVVETFSY